MTAFLSLDAAAPFPSSPSFLVPAADPSSHLKRVIKTILKARRIAVVCGAGISVRAGIPDFRSSQGLFQTLKKDHPTLSSGKDLFDASVFSSEETTALFCQMIAQLSQLSETAEPTPFHRFLRVLDERRRLLRVYTQNIDALEEKSGLSFGVPELDSKRYKSRASKGKTTTSTVTVDLPEEPVAGRLPSPPAETPRCIPLHGTLQSMHCQTCRHSYPLRDYIGSLSSGTPPPCPQCTALEETRQLVGKRSRGIGRLRPSVVLYNEDHKGGEEVGDVVRKDLIGSSKGKGRAGADLLLVVGTSLRVPGTKRIVREFSKAVRSRYDAMNAPPEEAATSSHGLATPTPSPRRSPAEDEEPPVRTVYLNFDFPVPTREWESVFDVWIKGDAQSFAQMVHDELEREERAKEAAQERKRRREEAAAESARQAEERKTGEVVASSQMSSSVKKGKKRKEQSHSENDGHAPSAKKRKTGALPRSPVSPPKKARKTKVNETKHKGQADSGLPTPPVSRDDSKRLIIKLPPRSQFMAGVVIETIAPKPTRPSISMGLPSSPLSSPPASTGESSPLLPTTICAPRHAPSPMCTPPRPSRLHSPPRISRARSGVTQLSSPLSSVPSSPCLEDPPPYCDAGSPYRRDMSPPMTPSPARSKRAASGTGSMIGGWLGRKPGVRLAPYGLRSGTPARDDEDEIDVVGFSDDELDAPPSDSRLPESYVRTAVHSQPARRRGRVR
ncbi:DHS-like NAD/FAD-binding domain-containing protein [Trametes gibbosa]|nr:DHS-like NAD/FAD-binding domain-containing protein [Trametes gibbosa]QPL20064.1 DHS-like NAD/FAD-binding domain-containing protein [Trametes gibbosa]